MLPPPSKPSFTSQLFPPPSQADPYAARAASFLVELAITLKMGDEVEKNDVEDAEQFQTDLLNHLVGLALVRPRVSSSSKLMTHSLTLI